MHTDGDREQWQWREPGLPCIVCLFFNPGYSETQRNKWLVAFYFHFFNFWERQEEVRGQPCLHPKIGDLRSPRHQYWHMRPGKPRETHPLASSIHPPSQNRARQNSSVGLWSFHLGAKPIYRFHLWLSISDYLVTFSGRATGWPPDTNMAGVCTTVEYGS